MTDSPSANLRCNGLCRGHNTELSTSGWLPDVNCPVHGLKAMLRVEQPSSNSLLLKARELVFRGGNIYDSFEELRRLLRDVQPDEPSGDGFTDALAQALYGHDPGAVRCAMKHADDIVGDSTDAHALCRLAEEVRRLRAAQPPRAWQPIETAPRDGTRILLAANVHAPNGKHRISSGHYSTDPYIGGANDDVIGAEEGFKGDEDECIPSNQECFTHWAPIPPFDLAAPTKEACPHGKPSEMECIACNYAHQPRAAVETTARICKCGLEAPAPGYACFRCGLVALSESESK